MSFEAIHEKLHPQLKELMKDRKGSGMKSRDNAASGVVPVCSSVDH